MSESDGTRRDGDTSRPEAAGGHVVPGGHAVMSDPVRPKAAQIRTAAPVRVAVTRFPAAVTRFPAAVTRFPAAAAAAAAFPVPPAVARGVLRLGPGGIAGLVAWALLGSRLFVVRSVVVTGTHLVPASQVLAAADIAPGTPLLRVNTGKAASRVAAIRQVRSVRVSTSWPDRVVITVQERTPALAVPAAAADST